MQDMDMHTCSKIIYMHIVIATDTDMSYYNININFIVV